MPLNTSESLVACIDVHSLYRRNAIAGPFLSCESQAIDQRHATCWGARRNKKVQGSSNGGIDERERTEAKHYPNQNQSSNFTCGKGPSTMLKRRSGLNRSILLPVIANVYSTLIRHLGGSMKWYICFLNGLIGMTDLPSFLCQLTCPSLAFLLCINSTTGRAFCALEDFETEWHARFARISASNRAQLTGPLALRIS